jgi:hypothetical protein
LLSIELSRTVSNARAWIWSTRMWKTARLREKISTGRYRISTRNKWVRRWVKRCNHKWGRLWRCSALKILKICSAFLKSNPNMGQCSGSFSLICTVSGSTRIFPLKPIEWRFQSTKRSSKFFPPSPKARAANKP